MNYHAALAHFPKITYQRYHKLAAFFSNLKNLWESELPELVEAGLEEQIAQEFLDWRDKNPVEKIAERLEREGIQTVSIGELGYPKLLKEITDPPHTLFMRGSMPTDDLPALAVVGTRKFTNYGKQACEEIVRPLAEQGMVIVSGMALGIDGIAHEAALGGGGKTIAVLGTGVNRKNIYPAAHYGLSEKILKNNGALITEYPPGFEPTNYSFPARNRIIAGLSLGTLIVEAAEESGALITARCALDYNREVFAIPHPINLPTGVGPNNLIKMGAKAVTSPSDITEALSLKNLRMIVDNRKTLPSTPTEAKILATLSREPKHVDSIIKQTGLDSPAVNSTLTLMEMKGKVRNLGGMMYVAVR